MSWLHVGYVGWKNDIVGYIHSGGQTLVPTAFNRGPDRVLWPGGQRQSVTWWAWMIIRHADPLEWYFELVYYGPPARPSKIQGTSGRRRASEIPECILGW